MRLFVSTLMLLLVGAFLVGIGPAGAHDGRGTLTLVSATPTGELQIDYEVQLVFRADGHPAADATVTAVVVDTDGTTGVPQPLQHSDIAGVYEGDVTFPAAGTWTVRFTAVTPPAVLERPATVGAAPPSSPTPVGTPPPSPDTSQHPAASPPTTTAEFPTSAPVAATQPPPAAHRNDTTDPSGSAFALFAIAAVGATGLILVRITRRRS